jgi:F-type H+-transporting ATPase subunit alpha
MDSYDEMKTSGMVSELSDGIAWIKGIGDAMYQEVITFGNGSKGLVMNLENKRTGAIILTDYEGIRVGDEVKTTGKLLKVGVGPDLMGRVIDPMGNPVDDEGELEKPEKYMSVEKIAPGIIERKSVEKPLQTGIKAIDAMIPIGRGQRELIIGDRGIGKTTIAIDTIINQKDSDVFCIYVAIGQKRAKIAEIIKTLKEFGVLEKTVIVAASSSDSAALQYLAPYTGCAIGEYFMEKGKDALVVYDDLTKHAWSYREISLLLRRPSGREAYPGDVFYLHSRLLERACQLSDENGGGSLTALPIIETQSSDVSAYIPTNVISITDGQIYLEPDLFFAGIRPALNVGLSVSRIGGSAQVKAMKSVAGKLRLDLSQYYELETFAQFATELDKATKERIDRGKRIVELLKQTQNTPFSLEYQVAIFYTAVNGYLDSLPTNIIKEFEKGLIDHLKKNTKILQEIKKVKVINSKLEKKLNKEIKMYKKSFERLNVIKEDE